MQMFIQGEQEQEGRAGAGMKLARQGSCLSRMRASWQGWHDVHAPRFVAIETDWGKKWAGGSCLDACAVYGPGPAT